MRCPWDPSCVDTVRNRLAKGNTSIETGHISGCSTDVAARMINTALNYVGVVRARDDSVVGPWTTE